MEVEYKIPIIGIDPTADPAKVTENIVSKIIGIITIIAFLYFAFQIIFAGIALISAEGDKNKAETAKKRLTDGILGLTIVVVAMGLASLLATLLGVQNVFDLTKSLPTF